ncbi:MAG: SGNH/GDSL hydrolase family protein [Planctomycetota bacterium]|jgi:hypothetical protein
MRWKGHAAKALVSVAVLLVAAEVACRLLLADRLAYRADERSLTYRHHERLGWFPERGSERELLGTRTIGVRHNARGFRDREHGPKSGPRLACYGDSFTWGYDAAQDERFTEHLQRALHDWEVLNLGVSGYGTDQALLLMQDTIEEVRPDVVLLVFTHTDVEDNAHNVRYDGYHKPYFEAGQDGLVLKGVPVPRAERDVLGSSSLLRSSYLLRAVLRAGLRVVQPATIRAAAAHERTFAILSAMRALVEAHGAVLVVGLETRDRRVRDFLDDSGFLHLDLSDAEHYPGYGEHWTPAGHADVAERVQAFLAERELLGGASR